jgi:CRP/FNR family transcriptional regulator, cyclic AMP receptor protein
MLTPAERKEFIDLTRPASYAPGEVLFREDDVTRHGFLIAGGSVKIVRRRPDGTDMILAVRGTDDLIGEMAAIDGAPRSAGAVALVQVKVHVIEAAAFESLIRSNGNVAWTLIRSITSRQRDTDQLRLEQATSPVAQRVAAALLDMADREVALDADGFVMSQAELAETVGATREAVSKALGEFRRNHAIETSRRRMKIVDRAKLLDSMGN